VISIQGVHIFFLCKEPDINEENKNLKNVTAQQIALALQQIVLA